VVARTGPWFARVLTFAVLAASCNGGSPFTDSGSDSSWLSQADTHPTQPGAIAPVVQGAVPTSTSIDALELRRDGSVWETTDVTARPPSLVATAIGAHIPVFRQPGDEDPFVSFSRRGEFREPRVFLVREVAGRWLRVLLPMRPNGASEWINGRNVQLSRNRFRVLVDLTDRRLTAFRGNEVVLRRIVAVGRRQSPTPTGLFFTTVLVRAPDPTGPYGPLAYGLSGFSEVYTEFAGGNGQIAIHGTNAPQLVGQAVSAGCVRMRNNDIVRVARLLPLGTPVRIVR
jgi:lipoprotein-anchoring transpeptidase ErfK/SrfK